jgi:small subunit ribosomal protein S1
MKDTDVSRAAQSGSGLDPMDAMPADFLDYRQPRAGDIVTGTIVRIGPAEILLGIDKCKSDGLVDSRELERLDREFTASLDVGHRVAAYVVRPEDHEGNVIVSLLKAQQEQDWLLADELLASQDVFEGVVAGSNRGGVIVKVGRVRGFVPASQLADHWHAHQGDGIDPEQRWAALDGQTLQLRVVEMDRRRNRLILSERIALRDWRKSQKDRLLTALRAGDVVSGTVTSLATFGAFVDLGGADGLIHLSELAWQRVDHPSEVVHQGQQIQVMILNIDEERKRIGLSLRRLAPEPWSQAVESFQVGQLVAGTITKLTNFGAFARFGDGLEGLIHISELSPQRITHPSEVVHEGEQLQLRIIRIDSDRRRVGLSLRKAAEEAYLEVDWCDEAGQAQPAEGVEAADVAEGAEPARDAAMS